MPEFQIRNWPGESFGQVPGVDVMITQFSAIFANFRRKIGVFLKKHCYDNFFVKTSSCLSKKRQFVRQT
jgi:hypothetical protein